MRGDALDLERGALGPGERRELGEEPIACRDRERVDEPDVRLFVAGEADGERRVVELPGDFSAGGRRVSAGCGRGVLRRRRESPELQRQKVMPVVRLVRRRGRWGSKYRLLSVLSAAIIAVKGAGVGLDVVGSAGFIVIVLIMVSHFFRK